jgi:hypothetical protein
MIPKTFAPENGAEPFVIMKNTNSPTRNDSELAHHHALAAQENYEHRHHRSLKPGASNSLQDGDTDGALLSPGRVGYQHAAVGFVPASVSYRRE